VVDTLDARIDARFDRKAQIQGRKETVRNYRDSGITVKAGQGAATMLVTGAATAAVGAGIASATIIGSAYGGVAASSGAAIAVAGGLMLAGPVLVIDSAVRAMNNSVVNEEIGRRRKQMPVELLSGADSPLEVFFPLAPSPKTLEITYTGTEGGHVVNLDTRTALKRLHIASTNNPDKPAPEGSIYPVNDEYRVRFNLS